MDDDTKGSQMSTESEPLQSDFKAPKPRAMVTMLTNEFLRALQDEKVGCAKRAKRLVRKAASKIGPQITSAEKLQEVKTAFYDLGNAAAYIAIGISEAGPKVMKGNVDELLKNEDKPGPYYPY